MPPVAGAAAPSPHRAPARVAAGLVATALALALVGSLPRPVPRPAPPPPPADVLATALAARVDVAGVRPHLAALQAAADAHDGHRADGSPGHDASVALVADALRAAGFAVETPEFRYPVEVVLARHVVLDGDRLRADRLEGSPETPADGVAGPLVVPGGGAATGCRAADLDPLTAAGAVLLVRRGGCPFATKAARAADAGAAALLVANDEAGPLTGGTLRERGRLPVAGVSTADGDRLSARAGTRVVLDLRTRTETRTSRNVVAQTRTGRADDVVVVGGHLDSVEEGPGINDNGSGAAALLELATALGPEPAVDRAVRFAWWGGEELGLLGSQAYVDGLDAAGRRALALYLNVDMLGSPNPGFFVYDGDDSADDGAGPGPAGSAALERTLVDRLTALGTAPGPTDFDGRSDYGPFIDVGVPAGGLFSGAEALKTPAQAARWGGTAGEPFDPCYHRACDDLGNVDLPALGLHLDALAWTVGRYAAGGAGPAPDPVAPRAVVPALAPPARRRAVLGHHPPAGARRRAGDPPR
ncbi:M28 family peptidase [Microlunatus capsulatus]|uniref:Zn-dependent M28 family amino/carboxypeptidase n=1 Tax=Microlunatus capsulatus TaxID=99117 RepID=A0ABS4Z722_9ACTN|nr:M28 family peptidase [Microlunatus capsulatus]MBP2416517.1 Zn-dependent M28 family amino/carboxypeptidase [Microlunatus capsulatus]